MKEAGRRLKRLGRTPCARTEFQKSTEHGARNFRGKKRKGLGRVKKPGDDFQRGRKGTEWYVLLPPQGHGKI